jgi:hypothetical protein
MPSARTEIRLDSIAATKVLAIIAGFVLAFLTGCFIVAGYNPLTTAMVCAAAAMSLVALINPKAGLYLLVIVTGYLDLTKRLGILTDSLSEFDISVTLAVAPLLMLAIGIGVIIHHVLERKQLHGWQLALLVIVTAIMAGVAVESYHEGGNILNSTQNFLNTGGYLPLIVIASMIFPKPEDGTKVLRFALWVYLPVALYGIWQQFFGFSDFERRFLESGLTITVTDLDEARPRPFSTLNSPHTLSVCTAIFAGVSLLVPLRGKNRFLWQYPMALIYVVSCVATLGRSGIFIIPIFLVAYLCFRKGWSTCAFYGAILGALALLMVNADPVLKSLDSLENMLPITDDVSEEAFHLGTFSDRLMSFSNALNNPQFHTLFGNPEAAKQDALHSHEETIAHDQITQTLVRYGFAGLALSLLIAAVGLWLAHRTVLRLKEPTKRHIAIAILSVVTAVVYSGMLFGSHLSLFPVDVFFALLIGILVICCVKPAGLDEAAGPANSHY